MKQLIASIIAAMLIILSWINVVVSVICFGRPFIFGFVTGYVGVSMYAQSMGSAFYCVFTASGLAIVICLLANMVMGIASKIYVAIRK